MRNMLKGRRRRPAAREEARGSRKPTNIIGAVAGVIIKVVVVILGVYFTYQGAMTCYNYGYRVFAEPAINTGEGRTVIVTVTEDMTPMEIGKLFESKGLVRDATLFMLQYYFSEHLKDVKPGTFELNTTMTAEDMMAVMAAPSGDGAGTSK